MSEGGPEPLEARRTAGDLGPNVGRANALHERLFANALGALELYTIYLGDRLGLYRALAQSGAVTSSQLAARTGTNERYVREWLEQHAASDMLMVDDTRAEPLVRRYSLPPEYIPVLANPDDVGYEAYRGVEIVRAGRTLPQLAEAFRVGSAPSPLPWDPEGRAEANRARFINLLGTEWLPAIVDVDVRLRGEPPAHVLDVACGTGWSSIAMAQAYPNINVDGVDLDHEAISAARENAEQAVVADRVTFSVTDAADLGGAGGYDLVTIFEALHDMSRPVDALSAARQLLCEDGTLLVVDGLVGEEFTVPASPRERTEYGWSVVSCLPGAMGDPQTAATGAVMRPSMLHQYALQAGFGAVEVLPIHTDYWRFYRLLR
jgi:2-polyprenyl-3-methyl-5-hydroxy-6-metoxy-1,4-benzoquinol methylase